MPERLSSGEFGSDRRSAICSAISLLVLRRFAVKLSAFGSWAGLLGLLGHGFSHPLALMVSVSGALTLLFGVRRREVISAPY